MNATAMKRAGLAWTEGEKNVFSGTVTTDPCRVLESWSRLSSNTWALEIDFLPAVLSEALLNTEKARLSQPNIRNSINRHLVRDVVQCHEMGACGK